ncbi:hypothetical protein NEOLI_002739 [Neolecta irregularis DAH-3]|uniref:Uncharacterized protein n=1 Tax=Neolecta irregularis (strain DAH-3) TaxID=1198029 RepID=A0A1U7LWL6_NEOID|nr:hypothetical protein NEOLI_002739 [Neolecta irregularis DAH-3]|eukprot:OLL26963.1 hypothetical protein NEOLI_002739 [Neolecta irregularis DAH-3]
MPENDDQQILEDRGPSKLRKPARLAKNRGSPVKTAKSKPLFGLQRGLKLKALFAIDHEDAVNSLHDHSPLLPPEPDHPLTGEPPRTKLTKSPPEPISESSPFEDEEDEEDDGILGEIDEGMRSYVLKATTYKLDIVQCYKSLGLRVPVKHQVASLQMWSAILLDNLKTTPESTRAERCGKLLNQYWRGLDVTRVESEVFDEDRKVEEKEQKLAEEERVKREKEAARLQEEALAAEKKAAEKRLLVEEEEATASEQTERLSDAAKAEADKITAAEAAKRAAEALASKATSTGGWGAGTTWGTGWNSKLPVSGATGSLWNSIARTGGSQKSGDRDVDDAVEETKSDGKVSLDPETENQRPNVLGKKKKMKLKKGFF